MNIRLRQVEARDWEWVRGCAEDPNMKEYWRRYPPAFSWLSPSSFLVTMGAAYIIEETEGEGNPLGIVNLSSVNQSNRSAEFGIMITSPGKVAEKRSEIAVEALKQFFDYCFNCAGLNKVYAHVLPHREDIKTLLTRWNFKKEGNLRDHCFFEGKFNDELYYGLVRSEFDKVMRGKS